MHALSNDIDEIERLFELPRRQRPMLKAAVWLIKNRADCKKAVVVELRERFGLSTSMAIDAIRLADRIRIAIATGATS